MTMNKKITLRHLEAFRAIILRHSVSSAADYLGVSQPVVTRLLQEFEKRLDIVLFDRERNRLKPTREAMLLYKDVMGALENVDHINQVANREMPLNAKTIVVASAPAMALSFLPLATKDFLATQQNIQVNLLMHGSMRIIDLLESGELDAGFVMLPNDLPQYGSNECIYEDNLVAAVPAGHRLSQQKVLTPVDFEGENFISMEAMSLARVRTDSLFLSYGVRRHQVAQTQMSMVAIKMVEEGVGLAIIDPLSAMAYPAGEGVVFIPFLPSIVTRYSLIYSTLRSDKKILSQFTNSCKASLKAYVQSHDISRISLDE